MGCAARQGRPQPTLGIRPRRLEGVVTRHAVRRDPVERRLPDRTRDPRGRTGFFRACVLPSGIPGARPQSRTRSVQPVLQPGERHPARDALPAGAARGGETGALHRRGYLRRHPRSPTPRPSRNGRRSSCRPEIAGCSTFRRGSPTGTRPSRRVRKSSTRCPLSTIREVRKAPGGTTPRLKSSGRCR